MGNTLNSGSAVTGVLAERRRTLRSRLIASGALSSADIAALRGESESRAREFVAKECERNRLFTVEHGGEALVPRILLDDAGQPTVVAEGVEVLRPLGLDGWELWAFLASPSGWLSGDIPADVCVSDPQRARSAMQAYAAELGACD